MTTMFTLDEITLFFWNLSNNARLKQEGATRNKFIASWVGSTQESSYVASASEPQSLHALAAHHSKPSDVCTSHSVSSRSIPPSWAVVKVATHKRQLSDDDTYANDGGGWAVSDCDELKGVECEEARNSPLKGKQRANNNVCSVLPLPHHYLRFHRASL